MILFEKDWLKYPGAIVDYQTSNKSFLRMAKTYQAMGIRNCLFFLALHDQSLQGVDPFDYDNLTMDQMDRISIECHVNPWYFLREIMRLPVSGTDGVPMDANRGVISQWWVRMNNVDCFTMQPRQTGKSVTADSEHLWNTIFRQYKSNMFLLTKDRSLVVKNTQRLKKMRAMLPPYLWLPTKKDKDVEDIFNYAAKENELILRCAQNDEPSAINAARGFTNELLHVDEVPFIKFAQVMIPAIAASMDAAIYNAMKNGTPYGKLFTTTAGDLSLPQGRYAYELYTSGCTWTEEFFDTPDRETLAQQICSNTGKPNPMVSMTFDHRMLSISDEEFWRRINAVPSTDEDINKDYFLIWGKGGTTSVLPTDVIDAMGKAVIQPKYNELTEMGYVIRWYIDKEDIQRYMDQNPCVLGIDTSEQIKRDSTALIIVNPTNLEVVATVNIADNNIITSAQWLAKFMVKYDKITLIIEKKSTAQSFIDAILLAFQNEGINPFKRFWNQIIDNRNLKPEIYQLVKNSKRIPSSIIDECRKYFGFNQTGQTRHLLYSQVLQEAASMSRHVIKDVQLVNQLSMLKINSDGKVDHQSSKHDDSVIAWLLIHWMLRFGKNLEYYGLNSRRVMLNVSSEGKQLTEDDFIEHEIIESLSDEAEQLVSRIHREKHVGMRERLEHQLSILNKRLSAYGVEPKTFDTMANEPEQRVKKNKSYWVR